MTLTLRPYRCDDDYWRVRAFLRQALLDNGLRQRYWDVVRFDYWRWHVNQNLMHFPLEEALFLWEDEGGEIRALLNPEGRGEAFLNVHPADASRALLEEMLSLAEERFAQDGEGGGRSLTVWCGDYDPVLQDILTARGYQAQPGPEFQRRRRLDAPIPEAPPAAGYRVHPMGDGLELLERCFASGLAFHPDEIHIALENRDDPAWYHNIQNAPLYRRDLDLVCSAPDGSTAGFCTAWFDDVTRTGVFEPVGTVPAHQRRGVGKALLCEGLRRLRRMGAQTAFVGSYSERAGALYASAGFTDYELSHPWKREWTSGM